MNHPQRRWPILLVLQWGLLLGGVLVLALCALGISTAPRLFFQSYLNAYIFWLGVPLGCMATTLVHHLTGGRWGPPLRPWAESALKTLPLMALLFLPLAAGVGQLYPWSAPEFLAQEPALDRLHRYYLNTPFFLVRSAFYLFCWIVFGTLLALWARRAQEQPLYRNRLYRLSAAGGVVFVLTVSFAAMDWVMSLSPPWYSSIYGLMFIINSAVVALALMILLLVLYIRRYPQGAIAVGAGHFHDLGNLLLLVTVLWAYFYFSQFLIVYSANLPHEVSWYVVRGEGIWATLEIVLVCFHFLLPFVLLLSRDLKRNDRALAWVCVLLLLVHSTDILWLVLPSFARSGFPIHGRDLLAMLGMGGLWAGAYIAALRRWPRLWPPAFAANVPP